MALIDEFDDGSLEYAEKRFDEFMSNPNECLDFGNPESYSEILLEELFNRRDA